MYCMSHTGGKRGQERTSRSEESKTAGPFPKVSVRLMGCLKQKLSSGGALPGAEIAGAQTPPLQPSLLLLPHPAPAARLRYWRGAQGGAWPPRAEEALAQGNSGAVSSPALCRRFSFEGRPEQCASVPATLLLCFICHAFWLVLAFKFFCWGLRVLANISLNLIPLFLCNWHLYPNRSALLGCLFP